MGSGLRSCSPTTVFPTLHTIQHTQCRVFTGFEDRAKTYTSKRNKNTINSRFPYDHFSINNLYIFVWIYRDCSTMITVYALDSNIVL